MSLVNVKCILCLGEIEKDHKWNLIYSKTKTTFDVTLPLIANLDLHQHTVLKYIWAYCTLQNETKPNETKRDFKRSSALMIVITFR